MTTATLTRLQPTWHEAYYLRPQFLTVPLAHSQGRWFGEGVDAAGNRQALAVEPFYIGSKLMNPVWWFEVCLTWSQSNRATAKRGRNGWVVAGIAALSGWPTGEEPRKAWEKRCLVEALKAAVATRIDEPLISMNAGQLFDEGMVE